MELNFNDILEGKDTTAKKEETKANDVKLKQTDTRARQQSCMISEIDKDLVPWPLTLAPCEHKYQSWKL